MAKAWLVTWTTYGSWLPGDPRGFRTRRGREYVPPPRRYAQPDEPTYDPKAYRARYQAARAEVPAAVKLSQEEMALVREALVAEIAAVGLEPLIMSVAATHIHLLARFGLLWIRPTVGRLKAAATRALPNPGTRKRIWTKECDMISCTTDDEEHGRFHYVRRHDKEGALIYIWPSQADRQAVGSDNASG